MPTMDPLFQAMSFFRRRKFEQCVDITTGLLEKNPNDQVRIIRNEKTNKQMLRISIAEF
jgi:hypothetical protein